MYKLYEAISPEGVIGSAIGAFRVSDGASIPFDPANTDYQTFKAAVLAGAELQDADGVAMSAADAKAYVKTLP